MNFINADELKKKYEIFGHFYELKISENEFRCRSVIEIISKKSGVNYLQDLTRLKPNAIFILMNPGSSQPSEKPERITIVLTDKIKNITTELIPAKPDPTIYQLMRIMQKKEWSHIRIINLSDLCNPDSGKFIELLNNPTINDGHEYHSIFSSLRSIELAQKINIEGPIYAAWGVGEELNHLIKLCLECLNYRNIQPKGLLKENTTDKYYHPLLRSKPFNQKEWLERITKL